MIVTRKIVLKITLVLASGRTQARCKNLVKVTVKFIRRGICFQQPKSRLSPERIRVRRREKYFLFPRQEMGAKTQGGGPHS
jgi:hypothetical protein